MISLLDGLGTGAAGGVQRAGELAAAIRRGDSTFAITLLADLCQARALQQSQDAETRALRALNLNAPSHDGLTPLHLAASALNVDVLRLLLELPSYGVQMPGVDPDTTCIEQRTALHYAAARKSAPACTQCISLLLLHQADPCMADVVGETPLDIARRVGCSACVRALEARVVLWQGRVDHYEQRLLLVPSWTRRWLVVLQDRRPNTGPTGSLLSRGKSNAVWKEISHAVTSVVFGAQPSQMCPSCSASQPIPDFVARFRCRRCNAELVVPPSLQMAVYGVSSLDVGTQAPAAATPMLVYSLPEVSRIAVRDLDEATWTSAAGSLTKGFLKSALQSSVASEWCHGISVELRGSRQEVQADLTFRVATEEDRAHLRSALKSPILAAAGMVTSEQHAATVQNSRSVSLSTPWACGVDHTSAASSAGAACAPQPPPLVMDNATANQQAFWGSGGPVTLGPPPSSASPGNSPGDPPEKPKKWSIDIAGWLGSQSSPSSSSSCAQPPLSLASSAAQACPPTAPGIDKAASESAKTVHDEGGLASVIPISLPQPSAPPASTADDEQDICALCMESRVDSAVVPCGHMCGCYACLQKVQASERPLCPICREPVASVVRIFKS